MIQNTPEYTYELTEQEMNLIPAIKRGFLNHKGKENAITGKEIAKILNAKYGTNLNDVRIRKFVNYLRDSGFPVVASSNGYYFPESKQDIIFQIESIEQRINSMEKAKKGLMNYLEIN